MPKTAGSAVLFALVIACESLASATPVCTPSMTILSGTLSQGATLSESGAFCTEGSEVFGNFEVFGATINTPIPSFTLTTGPATDAVSMILDFSFTNLGSIGQDIHILFSITPGITGDVLVAGPNSTVSGLICGFAIGVNGACSPAHLLSLNPSWTASNGGTSYSSVLPPVPPRASQDNADFVFENVMNGNGFAATTTPEPLTLWLMGAGLLAIGTVGRKQIKR